MAWLSAYSTPREFSNSINSLKSALRLMLGQLKKNVQPLFTGKFSVKFAIGFVRLGETGKFSCSFLHKEI